MSYQMRRSRNVTQYLYSLGESGTVLREIINSLKVNPYHEWALYLPEEDLYELCVENHFVLYEIQESTREVWILSVIPY